MINYNEYIRFLYPEIGIDACRDITLQVCDECCLNCSYCYQINKSHNYMTTEKAKEIIDLWFQMYEDNDPTNIINKNTHGLIIEFIGGEPFMNIDTIDYATTYFIDKCLKEDHEWLYNFKISISSNGMKYFDSKVQNYLKKFHNFISLTISIDGPKEIHDACRKDYNGNGSFDTASAALTHWRTVYSKHNKDYNRSTKITIAPENLHNFNTIFDFFVNQGITAIFANPVYEVEWTVDQAKLYLKELMIIADKLLYNPDVTCSIFREGHNRPKKIIDDQNWCGGDGSMLAFDPDGYAYPCLRYMESSLGQDVDPIVVGSSMDGIYNTTETKQIKNNLNAITRRNQSTDECFYCPIADGCSWCSAYNYQKHKKLNIRDTNICWMHRAASIANVYYWNKKYRQEGSEKRLPFFLEQKYALQLISTQEYDKLLELSL